MCKDCWTVKQGWNDQTRQSLEHYCYKIHLHTMLPNLQIILRKSFYCFIAVRSLWHWGFWKTGHFKVYFSYLLLQRIFLGKWACVIVRVCLFLLKFIHHWHVDMVERWYSENLQSYIYIKLRLLEHASGIFQHAMFWMNVYFCLRFQDKQWLLITAIWSKCFIR